MKRPLMAVASFYVAGIVFANFLPLRFSFLCAASLSLVLGALAWSRARPLLLWPLLVLTGWSNLALRTTVLSPHDLRTVFGDRVEYVTLRGTLVETPSQRVYEHNGEESWRTMAKIRAQALRFHDGAWQPAFGRVAVTTPGVLSSFFAGQTVEITGILQRPNSPVAEGLFDYRAYLERLGIYYQLKSGASNDWRMLSNASPPPLADRFRSWAKEILALGLPVEDEPLRLLWAMTLGWQTALSGEVAEPFMRSGTMHIFAISGLHIALIAGIMVALLRVLQVPRTACGLVVIPLIWFYTGVTGWQASAIRSTIMMTVIIAGWSLKRPSDLLNSLAAAAFIILVWDPQQLFQASFQLSFFVVLSLALFAPVLEKLRKKLLQPDPLLPGELRPRWQRWLLGTVHGATASLATSLAAWLGSIPLVACYFHFFTPVSLLANLVVVPLSSLALMSNLASLLVGGWFPGAAELFNNSAWLFMLWMARISEWAARLPGGCFNIAEPGPLTLLLYYALLVSVMAGWLAKPRLRGWVISGIAVLAAAWFVQWKHQRSVARLTVLPNAIFFDAPGAGEDWLIDCGNLSAAEFITKPFLRAHGVNRLPHFVLTHGDVRRMGGAELIWGLHAPKNIYFSAVRFRSGAYREFLAEVEHRRGLSHLLERGDQRAVWTVLHPERNDHFPQGGDNAIVLRGEINGTRILLLSDLGKPGQNALVERTPDLRADIVVSGLPQQTEPLADALIEKIQPKLIIITDSEYPATARAGKKLQARLKAGRTPVIYTKDSGAVTITMEPAGFKIRRMNATERLSPANTRDVTESESPSPPHNAPAE